MDKGIRCLSSALRPDRNRVPEDSQADHQFSINFDGNASQPHDLRAQSVILSLLTRPKGNPTAGSRLLLAHCVSGDDPPPTLEAGL
jgi:hypothetical protein